jgi:molecular chaperone DnaK
MKGPALGIDLGTTFSCVAHLSGAQARVIPNLEGEMTTPSVVAFNAAGETLVGTSALRQSVTNPERTFHAVKRLIGRKFEDEVVQAARKRLPYKLAAAANGDVVIDAAGRLITPQEVSALILGYLKSCAESYLDAEVVDAVITVPAHFGEPQRQATKDAAIVAGLNVLRVINEPTAASLAFGLNRASNERIAVFDMGGGTFDITLLERNGGIFQVLATNGDSYLGGEDFDQRIVDWALEALRKEQGIDLDGDAYARQRFREAAEKAKRELSFMAESEINLPFLASTASGSKHFRKVLSRPVLESLTRDLVERTFPIVERTFAESKLRPADISAVLLVGGQARMPLIRSRTAEFFGRAPSEGINPDECVALGAAVQSGILDGHFQDVVLLLDVTSHSLGIEIEKDGFEKIIEKNTTIPAKRTKTFTTVENDQRLVRVHVIQGEGPRASNNVSLATFDLLGLIPAPAGTSQVEVTFEIDANGLVRVTARDAVTGLEQQTSVQPSSGLSKQQVDGLAKKERAKSSRKKAHE